MKLGTLLGLSPLLLLVGTGAQAADPTPVYKPQGAWAVNFAEDSCSAIRVFAGEKGTISLSLGSSGPRKFMDVTVSSNTLKRHGSAPRLYFTPGPGREAAQPAYATYRTADGWFGIGMLVTRPADPSAVQTIQVEDIFGPEIALQTGSLKDVATIMDRCEDDLMASLGLDPVAQRSLSREVDTNFDDEWHVRTLKLQRRMIAKGSVRQEVRMLVDEAGKPFGCRMLVGAADQGIADEWCAVLMREAHFTPALDAQGKPVRSRYHLLYGTYRSTVGSVSIPQG